MKKALLDFSKDFFGNKFALRLFIWIIGFAMFVFSLALILVSRVGFATYDTLFQPIRILVGVTNPQDYGKYILAPAGTLFSLLAFFLHYLQNKKWRVDYLLAIAPAFFAGFVLDEILKISFFDNLLNKNLKLKWPIKDNAISILYVLIGIPFFAMSIGLQTASQVMPNNYAILVHEVATIFKKKFHFMQYVFDISFVAIGILISIINIYTNRIDAGFEFTWSTLVQYIGFGTAVVLLTQGYIINHTILLTKKICRFK